MSTQKVNSLYVSLILFLSILVPGTVCADEEHYINIIVGERPAGLGGAYTAVSDDTSGLFYNPAGIVFAPERNLSVSTNAYYISEKKYKNAIGSNSWSRKSRTLLPNFFGVIQPVGFGVFGFSYAVPDSIYEDQDEIFHDVNSLVSTYTVNFNKEDRTYYFGPSYAMPLGPYFSVGATLYYHTRRKKVINNQYQNLSNGDYQWTNSNQEVEEQGIRPLVGVMFSPPKGQFSLGLSVAKTYIHWSRAFLQTEQKLYQENGIQSSTRSEASYSEKRKMPTKYSLGVAWFPSAELLITTDLIYHTETGSNNISIKRQDVLNGAIGIEYYFTDQLALRSGFNTNYANTYEVGKNGSDDHVDIYTLSTSLTRFSRGTSLTFGGNYGLGNGRHNKGGVEGDATVNSYLFYLGTSYSY